MDGGSVADARVALTGVGTKVSLANAMAEALIGTDGSEAAVKEASEKAPDDVTIIEDLYGSEEYKAHLASVYATRAVRQAIENAS
jgi:carbon-monoxide dehydrogenase medium subunit